MSELIQLLNLPPSIEEITRTSDGFFLGQVAGDLGFNAFLGRPRFGDGPGREKMRRTWCRFTWPERRAAVRQARDFHLSVRDMLGR